MTSEGENNKKCKGDSVKAQELRLHEELTRIRNHWGDHHETT